jgi:hypothetical protein
MAQKKKAARRTKSAATGRSVRRSKVSALGMSLRLAAKKADAKVIRCAQEYVATATDLNAARLERQTADRKFGRYYAAEAAGGNRRFYNFLAQGDSWFDYVCGLALINWLGIAFSPQLAYFGCSSFTTW